MNDPQNWESEGIMAKGPKLSNKIVFFLGAGASKEQGYPLMGEFLDDLKQAFPSGNEQQAKRRRLAFETLLVFRAKLSFVRNYVSTDFDNIESLYSAAEMYALAYPEEKLSVGDKEVTAQELPDQIALAIWEVYRWRPYTKERWHETPPLHRRLLDTIAKAKVPEGATSSLASRTVVLTTNYDILVELAAVHTTGFSYGHDVEFEDAPGDIIGNNAKLQVLKLHGSANWFIDRDEKAICDFSFGQFRNFESKKHYNWPSIQSGNYEIQEGHTPLIIPPTFGKHATCGTIRQVWKNAIRALSEAKLLVFIGYSFPRTDTFLEQLFHISLLNNQDLRRVIVVNPDGDVGRHVQTRVFNDVFSKKNLIFWESEFSDDVVDSLEEEVHIAERSGRR